MLIPIASIRVGDRLRKAVRPERVAALADSIGDIGLQHPISVRERSYTKNDGIHTETGYLLVAGLHRLEAHRKLGLAEIEATIVTLGEAELQLWEIDENLCRADLTELEQGEHLLKRKEIYEWWRPETKAGAIRAAGMNKALGRDVDDNLSPTFTEDTAAKTGIDQRTVQRSIKRATKIDKKVRDRIRDNPEIADSGVELDALASMTAEEQQKAVALVEAEQADSIRDAQKKMKPPPRQTVAPNFKSAEKEREKRQSAFAKALYKLTPEDQRWAEEMVAEFFDQPVADKTSALRAVS